MRTISCFLLVSACWAQNVKITWVGQACFMIESDAAGPVVITDPPAASNGYPLPATAANVVTVSHNHSDHNFVAVRECCDDLWLLHGGQFLAADDLDVLARHNYL